MKQVRMAVTRRIKELGRAGKVPKHAECSHTSIDFLVQGLAAGTVPVNVHVWHMELMPAWMDLTRLGRPSSSWQKWRDWGCSQIPCLGQRWWMHVREAARCKWRRRLSRSFLVGVNLFHPYLAAHVSPSPVTSSAHRIPKSLPSRPLCLCWAFWHCVYCTLSSFLSSYHHALDKPNCENLADVLATQVLCCNQMTSPSQF